MAKLKKCPFCPDGEADETYNYTIDSQTKCKRGIHCNKCGCNLFVYGTEADLITAWETRPIEAELAGALENTNLNIEKALAKYEQGHHLLGYGFLKKAFDDNEQTLEKYKSK